VKKQAQVIEISDEEEEAQVEKTPPFKIPDVASTVESTSTTTQKRTQIDPTPKPPLTPSPPTKDSKSKEKPISKHHKHKPIEKKVKIPEEVQKKPAAVRAAKVEQPRRTFLSERITSKVQAKRNIYRLSRKEKNVLEVTLLRNHVNEILTGPQFQAKLPPFPAAPGNSRLTQTSPPAETASATPSSPVSTRTRRKTDIPWFLFPSLSSFSHPKYQLPTSTFIYPSPLARCFASSSSCCGVGGGRWGEVGLLLGGNSNFIAALLMWY
jgi:hypothetical protein